MSCIDERKESSIKAIFEYFVIRNNLEVVMPCFCLQAEVFQGTFVSSFYCL